VALRQRFKLSERLKRMRGGFDHVLAELCGPNQ
jgi:hypothetical protein